MPSTCPSPNQLLSLHRGELAGDEAARLRRHTRSCPACARTLEGLEGEAPTRPTCMPAPWVGAPPSTPVSDAPSKVGSTEVGATAVFSFLSPPQARDEMGRLGGYRVLGVLGEGGMGLVFRAEDPRLGRAVALKVLRPDVVGRDEARDRFQREARAAARLQHDHIVPIFQVGEDRGMPFIAMPLLKGASLETWFEQKRRGRPGSPLRVVQVTHIGRGIARGLHAAHEKGLVHRDIKPANIWLDASAGGRVRILDFGLARPIEGSSLLTTPGMAMGTPAYMAPEQAMGEKTDARSDLFSLGVVLYRLLTGELPFQGSDALSTMAAVTTQEPTPPAKLDPRVPEALSALVLRLLSKAPGDRPATAREVVRALQEVDRAQPASAPAEEEVSEEGLLTAGPRTPRSQWLVRLVVGIALVMLGLLVGLAAQKLRSNDPPSGPRAPAPGVGQPSKGGVGPAPSNGPKPD